MLDPEQTYRAGLSHLAERRLEAAESCFRLVIHASPASATGHYHLGVVLRQRQQWRDAVRAFREAIRLAPELARAYVGLGAVLNRLGQAEEAKKNLRKAIALDPDIKEAWLFLADLMRNNGELKQSRAAYDKLLEKDPEDAAARFGRGFINLLEEDLTGGWRDYEYRQARLGHPDPALRPQWRGENPAGKTFLLYAEQGIGDTIQFLRYAKYLAGKGARVFVAVPTSLMGLASRCEGVAKVLEPSPDLPAFDYCVPFPSLPLYCNTLLNSIPWNGSYLSPPPNVGHPTIDRSGAKTIVALAWAGNSDHPNDYNRSIALSQIEPLFAIQDVQWLILQRGSGAERLQGRPNIVNIGGELTNFSEIAVAASLADLVISVDTSFCHLAGALGLPVWTLLSYAPDWRWMLHRADSPWYPTMRLFRQKSPRNWSDVVDDVAHALGTLN